MNTKLNTALLKQVLVRIEKDYDKFDMDWFYRRLTKRDKKRDPREYGKLSCGTVCCFAGHAIIEAYGTAALSKIYKDAHISVAETAKNLLGFTDRDSRLFYTDLDYGPYVDLRDKTPGTKKYAKSAVACIRKYFADQGVIV